MKKLFSFILILTVLMVLVVGCGQKAQQDQQKTAEKVPGLTDTTITAGAIGDITGPTASTQAAYFQGVKDYIQFTNENGGVNGRKIELKIQDDQFKVDKTLAGFRKLIEEGTFAIVGQGGSGQFAAIDPEIKEHKIPVFGPLQTTKLQTDNPYTYNICLSYDAQGKIFVKRIVDIHKGGKPKIAFFTVELASSIELGNVLRAAAKAADVTIVQEEKFPTNAPELTAQITKLKQSGADYVVFFGTTSNYITYLRDAYRLGASGIPVIANFTGVNPVINETAGKEASKNFTGMQSFNPYYGDGPGLEELRKFAEKNKTSQHIMSDSTYIQGWTTGKVFAEALKRAGKNLTRESFLKAVESINNFDTGGLSSPVSFGPNKHDGITSARLYQYNFDQKKLIPISEFYNAD